MGGSTRVQRAAAADAAGGGKEPAARASRRQKGAENEPPAQLQEAKAAPGGVTPAPSGKKQRAQRRLTASPAATDNTASAMEADASPSATDVQAPPAAEAAGGLTRYELEREANIKRNLERMQALNLPVLAREVAPAAAAAPAERQRGLASRRRKAEGEALPPPRKSLRGQGLAPDGTLAAGIADELPDGSVRLVSGGTVLFPAPLRATRPEGTLAFASLDGKPESDAAFLETLRGAPACAPHGRPRTVALAGAVLGGGRVAKCTPKGVTHLGFQSREDALLLAAGDKEGNVGLWRVDDVAGGGAEAADAEADEDDASFRAFRPHVQYISGLRWTAAGASRLLTCSYDGSLRVLDPEAGAWLELHASAAGDEYSAFDCTPDGGACYVADNCGGLRLLDARAGTVAAPAALHDKRINTVHLEPRAGALLATAGADAHVRVWDVRALGGGGARKPKPLADLSFDKSTQSALFAPDGSGRLLVTCYNDTLTVWDSTATAQPGLRQTVKHDNQTGRWVLPFRAVWTAASDAIVIGSMKRETELVDASTGRHLARLSHAELMTAIPSRHAAHPQRAAIAAATASGRVHVWEPRD